MAKLTAVAAALGAAAASAQSLHHVAGEFEFIGRSAENDMVHFTAAMPMRNYDVLEKRLLEISDPTHPDYTQWYSPEEVVALTSTDPAIRREVRQWVTSTGAKCVDFPHSLRCTGTVAQTEKLLSTKLSAFKQHTRGGKVVHRVHPRDESWEIPESMKGKLSFISGLVDFPTVRRRNGVAHGIKGDHVSGRVDATDYSVMPETLDFFYNLKGNAGSTQTSSAPAEFQDDTSYNKADLKKFATEAGLNDWNVSHVHGPYNGASPDAEASLDEQYMGAVGQGVDQWYWTEAQWMYDYTQTLLTTPANQRPDVFSISWGWSEADQCTIDPEGPCKTNPKNSHGYVAAVNKNFATVTATGVSFLISSGDSGAHGRTDPSCSSPKTRPDWPTAADYITAVGATQIQNGVSKGATSPFCTKPPAGLPGCATGGTEIVASTATGALIVSGGGFSNVAPQSPWQATAIKGYLASGAKLPPTGDFNATGRGYPDVSAIGHNVVIWLSGQPLPVDGTSCSAPMWGGIIGLANSARVAAGKKVLGFLNQALYGLDASVWHDITVGNNDCTEDGCAAGCTGYEAAKGWDAATGFGSPDVTALIKALAALP